MKPTLQAVTAVATAAFLFGCAPTEAPPEALLSDAEARVIIESMMDGWDAAVAEGNADANTTVYTADAIRMQPGIPALEGREAIGIWMQAEAETYNFEGSNEIVEVRALSHDWILFRSEGSFLATPKSGAEAQLFDEKWLSIAQRQPDGSWKVFRDAGSSNLTR